jgi:hypothetical protein
MWHIYIFGSQSNITEIVAPPFERRASPNESETGYGLGKTDPLGSI